MWQRSLGLCIWDRQKRIAQAVDFCQTVVTIDSLNWLGLICPMGIHSTAVWPWKNCCEQIAAMSGDVSPRFVLLNRTALP